jgi:hypothetical protein
MEVNGQLHEPGLREKSPGIDWIGGWKGPRATLEAVVKKKIPSPFWDWKPRSSSPWGGGKRN